MAPFWYLEVRAGPRTHGLDKVILLFLHLATQSRRRSSWSRLNEHLICPRRGRFHSCKRDAGIFDVSPKKKKKGRLIEIKYVAFWGRRRSHAAGYLHFEYWSMAKISKGGRGREADTCSWR